MENSRSHQSQPQHRISWGEYARQRRCRMSIEQREQHLAKRHANYQASIQKRKQVAASCSTSRDSKKTRPRGYQRVILATRWV